MDCACSLCEPITVRLVGRNSNDQADLTPRSEWSLNSVVNAVAETEIVTDSCTGLDRFTKMCDFIEYRAGDCLLARYLYRDAEVRGDGEVAISGVGLIAQLQRRRFANTSVLNGFAVDTWRQLWVTADTLEPTLLTPSATGLGPTVRYDVDEKTMLSDVARRLDPFITWVEHGGIIYDWSSDDLDPGRVITPEWFGRPSSCEQAQVCRGGSVVNDVLVCYGEMLDQSARWPADGEDPYAVCKLQGPVFEFPEITNRADAVALAQRIHTDLAEPVIEIVATGSTGLDKTQVCWEDLIPGRQHCVLIPGVDPLVPLTLQTAALAGVGDCVTDVSATFAETDVAALADRIRVNT